MKEQGVPMALVYHLIQCWCASPPTEQQPHKTSQGVQQSCQIHYQQEVTIKNAFITQRIPKIPKNRNSSECTGNALKIMGWSFCYKAQEKIWQ